MLLNSVPADDLVTRGLVLSNAANAFADQGDAESADAFFNEAIALAGRIGDTTAESVRSGNYGWFLLQVGRPRRAQTMLARALQVNTDPNALLLRAVQTDNLAQAHVVLGEHAEALRTHDEALKWAERAGDERWRCLIALNRAAARVTMNHKDAEARALVAAQALVTQPVAPGTNIEEQMAAVTADAHARTADDHAALDALADAAQAALSYGLAHQDAEWIIHAQSHLGRRALALGDLSEAAARLDDATARARRADLRRLLAEALDARSQVYRAAGQLTEARAAWAEAARLYTILHMPQAKLKPAGLGD
jgi:tetratricopeptide (TPR) repeat protein